MNKLIFSILFFIIGFCSTYAQIVNVESLRRVSDTSKWSGSASLDIGLIKNTKSIFKISNKIRLQYKTEKNLYLLLTI